MSIRFMLSVFVVAAILVVLLAAAFYFGMKYHSWLMTRSWQDVQKQATTTNTPAAAPVPVETLKTLPLPEKEKVTIEKPTKTVELALQKNTQLQVGESTQAQGVTILFADVIYDGRCPEDSDCTVAGEAVVELVVKTGTTEQKVYLSSHRGGKSDYWAKWPYTEKDYSPAVLAQIQAAQKISQSTIYTLGTEYRSSKAVVGGYTFHLESLTPGRKHGADGRVGVIPKGDYKATFVIDRA